MCFNVDWLKKNMTVIIRLCSKIELYNVQDLKFEKPLVISKSIIFKTNLKTNLKDTYFIIKFKFN